jgi:hypothetical protein
MESDDLKPRPEELTIPQEVRDTLRRHHLLPAMWYVGPLAVRGESASPIPRRIPRQPSGPSIEADD